MNVTERQARFKRLAQRAERAIEVVSGLLMLVIVICLLWQVSGRYLFGRAPSWTEELATMLIIWVAMLMAGAVLRRGGHISVTTLIDNVEGAPRRCLLLLRDLIVVVCCGFLAWHGYRYAMLMGVKLTPALEISATWTYIALPIGMAFVIVMLVISRLAGAPFASERDISEAEKDDW
jgi:TRAP-type C4-dicarboxylate transport system permease small subunit